jgi:hypothetical protein
MPGGSPGDETYSPVIRVYDEAGNVIETHEDAARFQRGVSGEKQKAATR